MATIYKVNKDSLVDKYVENITEDEYGRYVSHQEIKKMSPEPWEFGYYFKEGSSVKRLNPAGKIINSFTRTHDFKDFSNVEKVGTIDYGILEINDEEYYVPDAVNLPNLSFLDKFIFAFDEDSEYFEEELKEYVYLYSDKFNYYFYDLCTKQKRKIFMPYIESKYFVIKKGKADII